MKRLFIMFITLSIASLYFVSCYYDNEEVLYPILGCDSTNITYHTTIVFMMDDYCIDCHSGPKPGGSVLLTSYAEVTRNESRITESIKHTGIYPMPQGGGMLDYCTLRQWDIWVYNLMPE